MLPLCCPCYAPVCLHVLPQIQMAVDLDSVATLAMLPLAPPAPAPASAPALAPPAPASVAQAPYQDLVQQDFGAKNNLPAASVAAKVVYTHPIYDDVLEKKTISQYRKAGMQDDDFPFFRLINSHFTNQPWFKSISRPPVQLEDLCDGLAAFITKCLFETTKQTLQKDRCLFCWKSLSASPVICDVGYGSVHFQCAAFASDSWDCGPLHVLGQLTVTGVVHKAWELNRIGHRCPKCNLPGASLKCDNWKKHRREAKSLEIDPRELSDKKAPFIHLPCAIDTDWHVRVKADKLQNVEARALCPFCWQHASEEVREEALKGYWSRFCSKSHCVTVSRVLCLPSLKLLLLRFTYVVCPVLCALSHVPCDSGRRSCCASA